MNRPAPSFRTILAALCLASFTAGCLDSNPKSSGFVNANGRRVEYSIDENADLHALAEATLIKFGVHEVRVDKEKVSLDGAEVGKFAATVKKIEIVVLKDTFTVLADGENVCTKKIVR